MAVTAIALGIAAVSTAASMKSASDAKDAAKSANAIQKKINRKKNAQARRQFLRNFRQKQAANLQTGIAAGIELESSRVQGTASSELSQRETALREFKEFDERGVAHLNAGQKAADAQFKSAAFGQVASFASSFISFGQKSATGTGSATGSGTGTGSGGPTF